MDVFYRIVEVLGGLGMFLYGMRVMGDSLKASSGSAMKKALAIVTRKPVFSFLLGVLVTCVIQSSTATIVLTVGLVGAGFLTFRQSIGIVLGANVGTAITAQVIRLMDVSSDTSSILYFFKADNLAPLALIIGMVLIMTSKSRTKTNTGNIFSGFGVLFMGLIYMSSAVSAFGDGIKGLLTAFGNSYILQFIAGVAVTGVIQSSSAVVGIIQSIASSVGISFNEVFAVIIGVNIGDCLTTYLVSCIGAKGEQKRTALVHVIYNIFAATLIIVLVIVFKSTGLISDELWTKVLNSGGVANVHGIFRLAPAIILLPFSKVFANISEKIIKEEPINPEDYDAEMALKGLDQRLIKSPALALDQSQHTILHMADIALHNFQACAQQIFEYDPERDKRIEQREDLLDRIADATSNYLVSIAPYISIDKDNKKQNYQLKVVNCFERIGDLAVNITESLKTIKETNTTFSASAIKELKLVFDACNEILNISVEAFKNKDYSLAAKIEPLEEVIDDLVEELNNRHVLRTSNQQCDAVTGIQFQNMLTNFEHVSDKCSDLGIYILEQNNPEILGNEHSYVHNLHHSNDANFHQEFDKDYEKYFGLLKEIPVNWK